MNLVWKRHRTIRGLGMSLILLACTFDTTAHAGDSDTTGNWQHRVMLYGWLPSINGTLNYDLPGSGGEAGADASDLVDNLKGFFMGGYEGRRDKWSLKADLIYLNLANSGQNAVSIPLGPGDGRIDVGARQELTGWLVSLYGGYNTLQTEKLTLDVMAGVRYLSIDVDAELNISGPLPPTLPGLTLSQSVGLWDGVVGVKGNIDLTDKWFVPYHFDVGTGDSHLTWQAVGGVGYHFNWGDVALAYRHLYYDQNDGKLIQDLEFSGPVLGVNFNF